MLLLGLHFCNFPGSKFPGSHDYCIEALVFLFLSRNWLTMFIFGEKRHFSAIFNLVLRWPGPVITYFASPPLAIHRLLSITWIMFSNTLICCNDPLALWTGFLFRVADPAPWPAAASTLPWAPAVGQQPRLSSKPMLFFEMEAVVCYPKIGIGSHGRTFLHDPLYFHEFVEGSNSKSTNLFVISFGASLQQQHVSRVWMKS